jgi:hypothetical protein
MSNSLRSSYKFLNNEDSLVLLLGSLKLIEIPNTYMYKTNANLTSKPWLSYLGKYILHITFRISIRDRKQQISSERDREFLEAKYEMLNRECKKVTEEIKQLEQPVDKIVDDFKRNLNLDAEIQGIYENKRESTSCNNLEIQSDSDVTNKISVSYDTVTMIEQSNDVDCNNEIISSTTAIKKSEHNVDPVVKQPIDNVLGKDKTVSSTFLKQYDDSLSNSTEMSRETFTNTITECVADI